MTKATRPGQVVSQPPVASCETLTKKAAAPSASDGGAAARCCEFFEVGHTMYKGVYLPSVEEWVAHGYRREAYQAWTTAKKEAIDRGEKS